MKIVRRLDGESRARRKSVVNKPLEGSVQSTWNPSGADERSRGYGSASLAEVLGIRQAQFEVPAACACQGTIDRLRH